MLLRVKLRSQEHIMTLEPGGSPVGSPRCVVVTPHRSGDKAGGGSCEHA